jgi:hypothetical protein
MSFLQYISMHGNKFKRFFKCVKIMDEKNSNLGKYEQIILCSDGGKNEDKGSFGIVVQCNGEVILQASSRVPEIYEELHSHRCECKY